VTLYVHGFGHFHPENEITNQLLEELDIGTDDAWIVERVGIRSRRTVLDLDYVRTTRNADVRASAEASLWSNAAMAERAARMALERAGVAPEQVGLLLSGSNAPDVVCPAEACTVAGRLGVAAPALDVNSACSSFVAGAAMLDWMRPEALPDFVLLVAVESLTRTVDYADRATAVLFGDGAAAAVLSPRVPSTARLIDPALRSDPSGADKVVIPRTGHVRQDGRAVQWFAIKRTQEGYEALREAHGEPGRQLHLVGHQANLRVLEQVCHRCDIPPERHHANVELRGNTGAASCPSVVSMHWEKWGPRDDVALVAVGGGLSWGRCLLRFGEVPA